MTVILPQTGGTRSTPFRVGCAPRRECVSKAVESFDLTGKVSLVTGATKGLGRAMVQGLAEAGSDIVVVSR